MSGWSDFVNNVLHPVGTVISHPSDNGGPAAPRPKPSHVSRPRPSKTTVNLGNTASTTPVPARPVGHHAGLNPFPAAGGFHPHVTHPSHSALVPALPPAPSRRPLSHSPAPSAGRITPRAAAPASPANGVSGASKAPSRPKTFTDGHGVVRPLSPVGKTRTVTRSGVKKTSTSAKPATDPLAATVDQIIAGMNQPLVAQQTMADDQARGTMDENHRLETTYDQRVNDLRTNQQADLANAMQKAAELKGLSADTIAKNQQWLMSLMGPDGGGGGLQRAQANAQDTASNLSAANDEMAQTALNHGQSLNDVLSADQVAGHGMETELNYQAQLAAKAQKQQLQNQISANSGQRAKMLYDMQGAAAEQALKQQVAEQQFGLDAAKLNSSNSIAANRLAFDQTRAKNSDALAQERIDATGASAAARKNAPGIYGNIPKRYDSAINAVYSDLNRKVSHTDKNGNPAPIIPPNQAWQAAWSGLHDHGLSANTAAILASKWFGDNIKKSGPQGVLKMLQGSGVSTSVQKLIIGQQFGSSGWKQANSKGALIDASNSVSAGLNHLGAILGG